MPKTNANAMLIAVALKIGATFWMAATVAAIKLLGDTVPLGQVIFARSALTLPVLFGFLAWRGGLLRALKTADPVGHAFRGMIGGVGMLCWFSAVQRLPLSDAQAIAFASPFFGVVLAVVILKETVQIYRWSAVIVGFLGVALILSEHIFAVSLTERDPIGGLLALTFAGLAALASIQIRRMSGRETPETIVIYFSVVTALLGLATIPWGWIAPDAYQLAMLLFIGFAGGASQMMLTHALKYSEASVLAPFEYLSMLWVVIFGVVLFGEIPSAMVLLGSAVIVASGIFVMMRERSLRRRGKL
ncbi:DMT family transporter [Agrobacterium tumefaciens]|nr:membrane protein [Agrobacterium tumefaciens]NSY93453.1 DMT family transporter [Agrobacterium tumefaciens]